MTWTNIEPRFDDDGSPKSMVTVVNGSRRPIRTVLCEAYSGGVDADGHAIEVELKLDYFAELTPDPGGGSFTFPERPVRSYP